MGKVFSLVAIVALFFAGDARAADGSLRGQWRVTTPKMPTYSAVVIIDAEHRVTWDAAKDRGRPAKFHGYVARLDALEVEIVLTDHVGVVHTRCTIESNEMLHCYNTLANGTASEAFILTRVGPGPAKLMPVLPLQVQKAPAG